MKLTDLEILTESDKFCVENLWKNAVRERFKLVYLDSCSGSFIQLACHNSFLLYKQAANVAQTEEATTTTNLFIDKFRWKRKSSEQRKTTREIFFFSPTKSTNTQKPKRNNSWMGWDGMWVSEWGWCGNCESNVRGCFGKFTQKLNAHNIIFFSLTLRTSCCI